MKKSLPTDDKNASALLENATYMSLGQVAECLCKEPSVLDHKFEVRCCTFGLFL